MDHEKKQLEDKIDHLEDRLAEQDRDKTTNEYKKIVSERDSIKK
jgi:hypothetical protein